MTSHISFPSLKVILTLFTFTSALKRLDASCSESSLPVEHNESISSMKMVEGAWNLASSKSNLTSFSESPLYLEVRVDDETLKKVVLHSVATAFASIVLPPPGGPTVVKNLRFRS